MAQEIPPNVALFVQGKIINKVLGDALEAHKHTSNPFFMKKHGHPTIIVFAFPDGFEGDKTWVDMGTRYRRLTEPLDIANYYRNALYKETEKYLKPGSRPKRYPFTQRWYEYSYMIHGGTSGESTFWAELEQLKITMTDKNTPFEDVKESILELEKNLKRWYDKGEIRKDTFLPESTLVNWWKTLPEEHRAASPIKDLISS